MSLLRVKHSVELAVALTPLIVPQVLSRTRKVEVSDGDWDAGHLFYN